MRAENSAEAEDLRTPSGLPIEEVYEGPGTPERPGEFPFTRGIHPDMYRGRVWTFRQYAGFANVEESNQRYRYLLAQGQTGLSIAFDLPTQIGYDSDDPIARGEVGKVGVPISSLEDMEALLDGIPLEKVSVSMTINSTAPILLAFLVAVARRRGIPLEQVRGTLQNDMLKEFISRRTYRLGVGPSLRLVADTFEFCHAHLPRFNPISISGYHMREAGATAVQEIGFTLANALAYFETARERGISLTYLARRVSFFWAAHNNLLEEVAKFRAARRLWAKLVRERLGLDDPSLARMRFHTQTAGSTLTANEPENNAVRVAIQALAAVLGGTQSLHTNSIDEALGLPSETNARTALRTQQILAHESGVTDTVDPLGGAPAVETLTNQIEEAAAALIAEIDARGGAIRAVESGYQKVLIQDEAYRHQRAVESGKRIVVGVNAFRSNTASGELPTPQRVSPALEQERIRRVTAQKAARAAESLEPQKSLLEEALSSGGSLVEALVGCAEAGVTVGEMMSTLVARFGEYTE